MFCLKSMNYTNVKYQDSINLKLSYIADFILFHYQKVREYGQEIPQSDTADQPAAPGGKAKEH